MKHQFCYLESDFCRHEHDFCHPELVSGSNSLNFIQKIYADLNSMFSLSKSPKNHFKKAYSNAAILKQVQDDKAAIKPLKIEQNKDNESKKFDRINCGGIL